MRCIKRGLILEPDGRGWSTTHCILPVPIYLKEQSCIRIFYGSCDSGMNSRIGYVDVAPDDPLKIIRRSNGFTIDIGTDGTFDECGIVPSSIICIDDVYHLYTVGFQRAEKTPYILLPGLLISTDLVRFSRLSEAPLIPRCKASPLSHGAPCVIRDAGMFRMWLWSATKWIVIDGKKFLDYRIHHALSDDGISWQIDTTPILQPDIEKGEFAVARPWVFKYDMSYHMFYSARITDKLYRIKYAESQDGLNWIVDENDPFAVDTSLAGWDSQMTCYPSVIRVDSKFFLFYNGNANGRSGFGFCELHL
jgi:predicted GH43/DUF377 family glycosyl hydrolase